MLANTTSDLCHRFLPLCIKYGEYALLIGAWLLLVTLGGLYILDTIEGNYDKD